MVLNARISFVVDNIILLLKSTAGTITLSAIRLSAQDSYTLILCIWT